MQWLNRRLQRSFSRRLCVGGFDGGTGDGTAAESKGVEHFVSAEEAAAKLVRQGGHGRVFRAGNQWFVDDGHLSRLLSPELLRQLQSERGSRDNPRLRDRYER